MKGVRNPGVIDLVTHDPKSGEYALIMIEDRAWDGSEQRLLELQAKANAYLGFALDGQMAHAYPSTVGQRIRLQLDCTEKPDPQTARFLERLGQVVEQAGLRFVVNVL